jgi:regulator of PEP synthase PpsR (kinase-PPPase family)
MSQQKRTAFFISDGTGITAGALGQLLAHFPETQFTQIRIPFTDSDAKVDDAQKRIVNARMENGQRPIVIMSIGNQKLRAELKEVDAYYIDLFDSFIDPLGVELKEEPLTRPGVAHSISGTNYSDRMEAINFALGHDDGMTHNGLNQANVILVGVSRSGKTPTSIYLAMQFGIKAANYPLTPEDFENVVFKVDSKCTKEYLIANLSLVNTPSTYEIRGTSGETYPLFKSNFIGSSNFPNGSLLKNAFNII